jgi:hypothetical protein
LRAQLVTGHSRRNNARVSLFGAVAPLTTTPRTRGCCKELYSAAARWLAMYYRRGPTSPDTMVSPNPGCPTYTHPAYGWR